MIPVLVLLLLLCVVYSKRRFFISLALCYFVLLFVSPFSTAITSLGEERANLSAFHTFVRLALVWFCLFPLPLSVWEGLRLVIVALLPFLDIIFAENTIYMYTCIANHFRCLRQALSTPHLILRTHHNHILFEFSERLLKALRI